MINGREITITLSESQVARVLHEACAGAPLNGSLSELGAEALSPLSAAGSGRDKHSRVLLNALRVLVSFPLDGTERELTDVARELDIPASTVHRHVATWTAIGLLEQNLHSRRYRRTLTHSTSRVGGHANR